jgi:uncharacterized membrane protein YkvI
MHSSLFQRIILPGLLFQSVIIGGGYATGRELVEFFLSTGPLAGILGMCLSAAAFSVIAALSFELARLSCSYDYRSFFKQLLGPGWFLFEIAYLVLGILVVAVIGAAAGTIVAEHLGLSSHIGTIGLMALIVVLVFWGTKLIEKVLAAWSFVLYAVYIVFVALYLWKFSDRLPAVLAADPLESGWVINSLKYVGYSTACIPIILFCVKHMGSRKDALLAGLWTGPLGMIPALLFYMAMVAAYPDIQAEAVPADFLMQQLHMPLLKSLFYVVVFGTFVETGTAFIHAINERIAGVYAEKQRNMPRWLRPVVAIAGLLLSILLATKVGLIDLIAKGYGTLTWAIIVIYLVPLFTIGVYKAFTLSHQSNSP